MAKTGTKSVSATISAESYDAIEEYRWTVRKNLSQVVDQAISEFIAAHNIALAPALPAAEVEVPAEDKPAEDKPKGK